MAVSWLTNLELPAPSEAARTLQRQCGASSTAFLCCVVAKQVHFLRPSAAVTQCSLEVLIHSSLRRIRAELQNVFMRNERLPGRGLHYEERSGVKCGEQQGTTGKLSHPAFKMPS